MSFRYTNIMYGEANVKSKLVMTLIVSLFSFQTAFGAWTYVPEPSKKRDQASAKALKLTKNVRVDKLLAATEPFFTTSENEALLKALKDPQAKKVKIDEIIHGKDSFVIKSGDVKVVYKWINKNNIAFSLNGTNFTYEEASKTEIWQPKVHEVIKASVGKKDKVSTFSSSQSTLSFGVLNLLFHADEADAFLTNPWVLGAVGVGAIALIGLSFYNKHKEEHQKKFENVQASLSSAKQRLEKRRQELIDQGVENPDVSAYQAEVDRLSKLAGEYGSAVEDVGYFGYLFGKRVKTPTDYNQLNLGHGVQ